MRKQGYAYSVLIVGLVVAGLALVNSSFAAQKINEGANAKPGHSGMLKALHEAHDLLVHAEHDYDGHRAKAVHLVTEAIHKLKPPTTGAATNVAGKAVAAAPAAGLPKAKNAPAGGQAPTMTQAESDHHLQQASEIIKKIHPHVQDAHPEAAGHLADAMTEIATALSIK